jgi:VanZ family protein
MMDLTAQKTVAPEAAASPKGDRARRWLRVLWPIVVAGLIFLASSRSRVIATGVTRMDDKFVHFAVYGLLATLVCRVGQGWRAAVSALIIVSAFGASDEWHQSFVPGRFAGTDDWIADTLGAALAVTLYWGWARYREILEMPLFHAKRSVEKI